MCIIMLVMGNDGIKFICGKPALLCNDALVIADIHIGIEREFNYKGIRIGSMVERIRQELLQLIEEEKPKQLILLGDVKHTIVGEEQPDLLSLRNLLAELSGYVEVVVIPGNHDAGIHAVGNATVVSSKGIVIGDIGLAHGHTWPEPRVMNSEYLVVGHAHPCVEFIDSNGYSAIERIWEIAEADKETLLERYPDANESIKLVVMPAFNTLAGGTPVNRGSRKNMLGPLFKSGIFKLDGGQIFLLDGTALGSVASMPRYK